jgi:hypothetical protein
VQRGFALERTEFLLFETPGRIALVLGCSVITPFALGAGQYDNFLWHRDTPELKQSPALIENTGDDSFEWIIQ